VRGQIRSIVWHTGGSLVGARSVRAGGAQAGRAGGAHRLARGRGTERGVRAGHPAKRAGGARGGACGLRARAGQSALAGHMACERHTPLAAVWIAAQISALRHWQPSRCGTAALHQSDLTLVSKLLGGIRAIRATFRATFSAGGVGGRKGAPPHAAEQRPISLWEIQLGDVNWAGLRPRWAVAVGWPGPPQISKDFRPRNALIMAPDLCDISFLARTALRLAWVQEIGRLDACRPLWPNEQNGLLHQRGAAAGGTSSLLSYALLSKLGQLDRNWARRPGTARGTCSPRAGPHPRHMTCFRPPLGLGSCSFPN